MIILSKRYIRKYYEALLAALLPLLDEDYTPGVWDKGRLVDRAAWDAWLQIEEIADEIIRQAHDMLNEEASQDGIYIPFNEAEYERLMMRELDYVDLFFQRFGTDLRRAVLEAQDKEDVEKRKQILRKRHMEFAETAAWTETMALMFGYTYNTLKYLEDWGYEVYLQWFTVLDDRTCPYCRSVHGKIVRLGQPFMYYRGVPVYHPPAHVRCRCAVRRIYIRRPGGKRY